MSKDNHETAQQLRRLSHLHADAVDAVSDGELIKEAEAVFGSFEAAASGARDIVRAAVAASGKRRLEQARLAYDLHVKRPRAKVFALPIEGKRALLNAFAANDVAFKEKLTLAARHGTETESDLDGFLEDLLELGVIDESGKQK